MVNNKNYMDKKMIKDIEEIRERLIDIKRQELKEKYFNNNSRKKRAVNPSDISLYAMYCVITLMFFIISLPRPYLYPLMILQWNFILLQIICLIILMKGGKQKK